MVYDCFAFFNELDLLEIRLNELKNVVDRFVIVEATRTFQKNPKPLYFEENKKRFEEFLPKIIHVVVDEYPGFFAKFRNPTPRDYDNHQKEFILKGIIDASPEDTIIVSDVDEIPKAEKVRKYAVLPGIKIFEQHFYYYFLNCLCLKSNNPEVSDLWRGPVMLKKREIRTIRKVRTLRGKEGEGLVLVEDGGWHFSYMGGIANIIKKIEALSHDEFNHDYYKNPDRLEKIITEGKDLFDRHQVYKYVPLNDNYPEFLIDHLDRFKHLIKY